MRTLPNANEIDTNNTVNEIQSDPMNILEFHKGGIGPTLFLVFIKDLKTALKWSKHKL